MNQGGLLLKNDLSLIHEKSMTHEESFMLRTDQSSGSTGVLDDKGRVQEADSSILFGEAHPFRQIREDSNDVFTVSARP